VRVPEEFVKAADAEILVRIQTAATGTLEASKKLAELPKEPPAENR